MDRTPPIQLDPDSRLFPAQYHAKPTCKKKNCRRARAFPNIPSDGCMCAMKILLIKPKPDSFQFGLAPFFQTEPLGLQYVAASLEQAGHSVEIWDMRFER